jgi:hypothetical protein
MISKIQRRKGRKGDFIRSFIAIRDKIESFACLRVGRENLGAGGSDSKALKRKKRG